MSGEIADLIERLERASGPSRELDGRIWAEIDGRDVRVDWCGYWKRNGLLAKKRRAPHDECVVGVFDCKDSKLYTVGQSNPPPEYTSSIDTAMTLVPEGWAKDIWLKRFGGHHWMCELHIPSSKCDGRHVHAPIAICIAALRARATGAPHDGC